jgi:hypothetical protein
MGGRFQPKKQQPESHSIPAIERPPLPPDDFAAAVAAELGQAPNSGLGDSGPDGNASQTIPRQDPAPAPAFDPNALTMEGLTNAWQLPFWALGQALKLFRVISSADPIIAVGKRRAKDLARPSYAIYEHYTRQYLGLHPENEVHVAIGVTGLNASSLLPELVDAIVEDRRRSAAAAAAGQGRPPSPPSGS